MVAVLLTACRTHWRPSVELGAAAPPAIPWQSAGEPPIERVSLTPCPPSWHTRTDGDGIAYCDPFEGEGPSPCAADAGHFPGELACRTLGAPCDASDPFPRDLPTDRPIVYVLAAAATGGDGSRERPYASLTDAIDAAPEGSVVAVGRGRYDDAPIVTRSMDVVGACVAGTLVAPSWPSSRALLVRGEGVRATISGLTFTGAAGAIGVIGGAQARVHDVVVASARGAALWLESPGTQCTVSDLVVRPPPDVVLAGLTVGAGAALDADRVLIEGLSSGGAVYVTDVGSRATLRDLAVRGAAGTTVGAAGGGALTVERAWLGGGPIFAADDGSALDLTDGVVVGGGFDASVHVVDSQLRLRRLRLDGHGGVTVAGQDAVAMGSDLLVRDVAPDLGGLGAVDGSRVTLARVSILRASGLAVVALGVGTSLALRDVRVADVTATPAIEGRAVLAQDGAALSLEGAVVERAVLAGVACQGVSTSVSLVDVLVRDIADGAVSWGTELGGGLQLDDGHASLSRVVVERTAGGGIREAWAHLEGADVIVRDVGPVAVATDGSVRGGVGVGVFGGTIALRRFRIERAAQTAFSVAVPTTALLEDGTIASTPSVLITGDRNVESHRVTLIDVPVVGEIGFANAY